MKIKSVLNVSSFIIFIFFAFFQFQKTSLKNVYSQTPAEIDRQITRMRYYPKNLTRLGYWFEGKKETQLIYKLEENFFDTIDLGTYFPDRFPFIILPLFLVGIYWFFQLNQRFHIFIFLLSIIITSITGVNGKHGPILMNVFVLIFSLLGIIKTFNILWKKN